ncbi:MAG: hypothetical protein PHI64_18485 [Zoogloea sp.]|uniref:hypothetical protein n=1 Tax=Zoogloea sp. TaxID=49181 RepID=UPI002622B48F|nr:hypothetical protein [Zoogloea sp.]MDD2990929.1 hypothetical protein [Zoogloea sp.]
MHTLTQTSIRRLPEHWRRLGTRVRLGLTPDEPRLIAAYLETGRQACLADLLHPWRMSERCFETLLATAQDPQLPWHWRLHCLNHAHQPLMQLKRYADNRPEWRPLYLPLVQRLARASMAPSTPPPHEQPYGERPVAPRKT